MQLLNTLYVTTPETYLRLDNDTLRVQVQHETRLRVPLHHLSAVVCFGHINLSAPLMHLLADRGIALVLLDDNGRFKARLEGAVSGNVLLRQAQFQRVADPAFTLDMARASVAGKLKNTRQVLQRGAREAKAEDEANALARLADDLAASLRALPGEDSLDGVRGIEGGAARRYFSGLNLLAPGRIHRAAIGRRAPLLQRPESAGACRPAYRFCHGRAHAPPPARPAQRPAVVFVRHVDERLPQRAGGSRA